MPAPLSPLREARRARLRQLHAAWLAADIATLKAARGATFRAIVPGCAAGVAVVVLVVTLAVVIPWPPAWWTRPLSLVRLLVMAAGTVWIARTFLFARPDEGDAALARQDDQLEGITRRLFGQLRTGATYEPREPFERDWLKAASFATDGTVSDAAHRVRWKTGEVQIEAGEVDVERRTTDGADGASLRGWVAVGTMPKGWKARVRVRPKADAPPPAAPDDRMPEVAVAELGESYVVTASDPGAAHRLLVGSDLVARLRAEAADGRRVHLAVAWRDVVVVVEHEGSWFHRLHHTLDEAHVVLIGETLDLLDDVIMAVTRR